MLTSLYMYSKYHKYTILNAIYTYDLSYIEYIKAIQLKRLCSNIYTTKSP